MTQYEFVDLNINVENLIESDNIVAVQNIKTDEYSAAASLNDNFQGLEKACPEWQQDTQAIHPKWLEHHQSGHLTKIQVAVFVWKKQEAKFLIAVEKATANPESCIVICPFPFLGARKHLFSCAGSLSSRRCSGTPVLVPLH